MTQNGVTATCPGCGMVLPEEQTPAVCELCGASKATIFIGKMGEEQSMMACETCLMLMYAKAAAEIGAQLEATS
jgi:hypothetical protein